MCVMHVFVASIGESGESPSCQTVLQSDSDSPGESAPPEN